MIFQRGFVWLSLIVVMGCGTKASATKIEMDRVDRSLADGNQGYLIGTPPSTDLEVGTREMMEVEVVLPAKAGKRTSRTITESETVSEAEASEPITQPEPQKKYYKK